MIRISKLADYAVVVLSKLSESPILLSAGSIAEKCRLPEPTVSKVLKLLSKSGIVLSVRGANGGYKLAKPADRTSVQSIITAIDGPISITSCADGSEPDCALGQSCSVRGRWNDVNTAIQTALDTVTLADMGVKKQIDFDKSEQIIKEEHTHGSH